MGQAYTLLLVEDEENILYGMQSVLSCYLEEISEVYIARNGKEALDIIRKEKISIIISDLRMPEMNGVEMIKKIREKEYDIPIIVLTALADFKLAQELIPLRIESYILKPFSVEDICGETKKAIEVLRKREALEKAEKILQKFPELLDEQEYQGENPLIKEARNYILRHIKDMISLQKLSDELHVSKAYLSTLFRQEMNVTLTEFITKQRMKLAKRYLLDTDMRICEIFEEVGYQSDKYFIQVFKEQEGMTHTIGFQKKMEKSV